MKIVLGSKSPRRQELMATLGFDFIVDAVDVDENIIHYTSASDYVKQAAFKKGKAILTKFPDSVIVCADTIVVFEDNILGKPHNIEEARKMITALSNNFHYVFTGVVIFLNNKQRFFIEKTKVFVDGMTPDEIEAYIQTEEPYDKAGGYAIQGNFGKYIKRIEGDYYNVMGLPLNHLYREIIKIKKSER
ncbi:MAG: Maf family protein [Bacilli bacterium]|nr:Maf family protein [Bacilli bacterium]MDD4076384.1 Maf family protein [Bacilli bacterium]MDD4388964.1 Maf family protein [Bacilli bacterium]